MHDAVDRPQESADTRGDGAPSYKENPDRIIVPLWEPAPSADLGPGITARARESPDDRDPGNVMDPRRGSGRAAPLGQPERPAGDVARGGRPARVAAPEGNPPGDLRARPRRRGLLQPRR